MKAKYMSIIDDRDTEIKRFYQQDDDDSISDEDLWDMTPDMGDQIWIPDKGLYSVQRTRWMIMETPYYEVKVSFIRTNL